MQQTLLNVKYFFKKFTLSFPLHPVLFYGQDYEKQRDMNLVASLSKCYKTCLEKFRF